MFCIGDPHCKRLVKKVRTAAQVVFDENRVRIASVNMPHNIPPQWPEPEGISYAETPNQALQYPTFEAAARALGELPYKYACMLCVVPVRLEIDWSAGGDPK